MAGRLDGKVCVITGAGGGIMHAGHEGAKGGGGHYRVVDTCLI